MRDRRSTKESRTAAADREIEEDQSHPRKIFVGGLAHKTSTQHLRDYFARFGNIVDAVVLRWPDGRSRGFGYVTFCDVASAAAAMLETHQVGGRKVDVKRAVPGTNKLFVGGLPQSATAAELREHFEACGTVSDAVVMIDPVTGRSRGFGFVCFLPGQEGAAAVTTALEQYQTHRLRGKWIEVKSAAPPHKLISKDGDSELALEDEGATTQEVQVPGSKAAFAVAAKPGRLDLYGVASPNRRHVPKASSTTSLEPQKVSLTSVLPAGLPHEVAPWGCTQDRLSLDAALRLGSRPNVQAPFRMPFPVFPEHMPCFGAFTDVSPAPGLLPFYEANDPKPEGFWSGSKLGRNGSMFDISEGLQRSLAEFIRLQTEASANEAVGGQA